MFAVIVTFQIVSGKQEAFLPLMVQNAQTSLAEEPGCHVFDICKDPNRPDEVFLYELYSSAQAFQEHLDSSHFKAFDTKVASMIASKTVATYEEVRR